MSRAVWGVVLVLSAGPLSAAPPLPRVPEGFEIEIAAEFPVVERPVMACFDDSGKLYLVDSAGVNESFEKLVQNPQHRIVVIEDTGGDGKFDKRTVFADKLAMPQGVLPYKGAVYTASPPSVWKLEDTDGDGVCDRRTAIVGEFGSNGNAADIHGPFLGPDGWLYLCDGRHGHKVELADGSFDQGLAGGIFRFRPDGSRFERICGGGFDNPVEIVFTDAGEILGTVNILHVNPRQDCLMHWIDGGVYPHGDQEQCIAEYKRTGDLLTEVKAFGHVAVSGLTMYRTGGFGPEYHNNLFITFFNRHQVIRSIVERSGATFTSREEEFLVSDDTDFHPTDVLEDADGSLLVINTGGWFRIGCPVSEIAKPDVLGAIYRIRRKDVKPIADPRGREIDFDSLDAGDVVKRLDDPRPAVRERAIESLASRGETVCELLLGVARNRPAEYSTTTRRNARVAMRRMNLIVPPEAGEASPPGEPQLKFRIGGAQTEIAGAALADPDPEVKIAALSGAEGGVPGEAEMHRLLAEVSPAVRRQAALSLARRASQFVWKESQQPVEGEPEGNPDEFNPLKPTIELWNVAALLRSLTDALRSGVTDRMLEHSLIYAMICLDRREETIPFLSDSNPQVRRAALIALDQMDHGDLTRELVTPLLDTDDPSLRKTALGVIAARAGWATELVGLLREWLGDKNPSDERLALVRGTLVAQGADPDLQRLIAEAIERRDLPQPTRLMLWEVVDRAPIAELPASWLAALAKALGRESSAERSQIVAVIRSRGLAGFDDGLRKIAADANAPVELRIDALSTAAPRMKSLDDRAFALLVEHLQPNIEPLPLLAAARGIAEAPLSSAQLRRLAARLPEAGPLALPIVLRAFAKSTDGDVGLALVSALQKSAAAENLSVDELARILGNFSGQKVQAAGKPLLARLGGGSLEQQKARLAELSQLLEPAGNAERGKQVFFGKKAACSGCHAVGAEGGRVGPDLTKIGASRAGTDLLEAIVFPSATFAREFRPYLVLTREGKVHTGIISRQTADAIVLRTADLAEIRVPRADIEELKESNTSIMPKGLDAALTADELRDLLAYVRGLK